MANAPTPDAARHHLYRFGAVAFDGALSDYLCPSLFRDLCDHVFAWPFVHFGERVSAAPDALVPRCLARVPLIYVHGSSMNKFATWAKKRLTSPYIVLSGQSDFPASRAKEALSHGQLALWFAQNADFKHPKLKPLPIGLNCFAHAPEMHAARREVR